MTASIMKDMRGLFFNLTGLIRGQQRTDQCGLKIFIVHITCLMQDTTVPIVALVSPTAHIAVTLLSHVL